jgi:hypothetical protein
MSSITSKKVENSLFSTSSQYINLLPRAVSKTITRLTIIPQHYTSENLTNQDICILQGGVPSAYNAGISRTSISFSKDEII